MSEQTAVLDGAAAIAVAKLKEIKAPAEAKAAEEAKVASVEKAKQEQAEKDKGIALAKDQEAKTKEDARIISEDDTKLSDTEKKRKAELIKAKEVEENTPDAKIKRVQEATQKRIDEIISEGKSKEAKQAAELATLKAELEELKNPKQQEDLKSRIKREQSEQIAKYVDEDKSKPLDERREMTKEELQSWYLENPDDATAWISRRELRRARELEKAEEAASKPVDDKAKKQEFLDDFVKKQNESKAKLFAKYPGANPSKELISKTKIELGLPLDRKLTNDELMKINNALSEKNEEFKLVQQLVAENPKEYLEKPNGPELVMAEMEKRLNKSGGKTTGKLELTQEELDAKIEAEIQRRKLVDGEGVTSTHGGKKVESTQKEKSELRQIQEKAAKKAGMTVEQLDAQIVRRSGIKGANSGAAENK